MNEVYCAKCGTQLIQPKLIKRLCGGWLAVSPLGASIRIGVTGKTEESTRELFAASIQKWTAMLAKPPTA